MLGRLELKSDFRSLTTETFAKDIRFGHRTIIYGHNGSGKSSLSELLYQTSASRHGSSLNWYDSNNTKITLKPRSNPPYATSVFCDSWVQDNVADFLDGETAAAIVTLGQAAKQSKELEQTLKVRIKELTQTTGDEVAAEKHAHAAVDALIRSVQGTIVNTLQNVDPKTYTKNRFNSRKVKELLQNSSSELLTDEEHKANLEEIALGPLVPISLSSYPSQDLARLGRDITDLLNRNVESVLLHEILESLPLQDWLKKGLELHSESSTCQFCENAFDEERRLELKRHFDDSRQEIQDLANGLLQEVVQEKTRVERWLEKLPVTEDLHPALREEFSAAITKVNSQTEPTLAFLEAMEKVLGEKIDSPEKTEFNFENEAPPRPEPLIENICQRHDTMANQAEERKSEAASEILQQIIASEAGSYIALQDDADEKSNTVKENTTCLNAAKTKLQETRAKQFSSKEMADRISRDLATVFGRNHLSIELSSDGKSYRCVREGQPASHLSEGERNTLALIYFLRHLEDEEDNVAAKNRFVVIDDPSSSLDRENVYAVHSWLLDLLTEYGQTLILTHDFEMLRLFLNSQSSQLTKHRRIIKDGMRDDATPTELKKLEKEKLYPRISFLELQAYRHTTGARRSRIIPLSNILLNHKSEYHFLFERLISGIEQPEKHHLLFLLPNTARRVLESFTSFNVPDRSGFEQQLRKIALEDHDAEYRDVYDFCNRFSHGEGREAELFLDATTVYQQIRRCAELIKTSAPKHYKSMCAAIGRKNADPLTADVWAY